MCVTNTLRRPRSIKVDGFKVSGPTSNTGTPQRSNNAATGSPQFSASLFFGSIESTLNNASSLGLEASAAQWSTFAPSASTPAEPTAAKPQRPKRKRKPQKPGKTAKMNDRHFVVHNYHDHALDSPEEADVAEDELSSCGATKRRGGVSISFPLKLHAMLDQIEADGLADVISWQPHGRSFLVHKPKEFVSHVMPKYFRQSKLTSFQRQLNLYGFCRLTKGSDNKGYYHELFLRGRPFLCKKMVRTKVKGTGFKAASSPDQEPDFYTMPPVIVTPPTSGASDEDSIESDDQTMSYEQYPQHQQQLFCEDSSPSIDRCNSDTVAFAMAPISPMSPVPPRREFNVPQHQQLMVPTLYPQAPPSAPMIEDDHVFDEVVEKLFLEHVNDDETDNDLVDDFVQVWAARNSSNNKNTAERRSSFDVEGAFDLVEIDTDDEALQDDFQLGCLLEKFLTE
jgi:hypothetical protein